MLHLDVTMIEDTQKGIQSFFIIQTLQLAMPMSMNLSAWSFIFLFDDLCQRLAL